MNNSLFNKLFAVFAAFCCGTGLPTASSAQSSAWLIRVTENQRVEVVPATYPPSSALTTETGLLIWADASGRDRWQKLPIQRLLRNSAAPAFGNPVAFGGSRGSNGGSMAGGQSQAMLTTQLDQLVSGTVLRAVDDGGIFTPMNDTVQLSGQLTIRRTAGRGTPEFPADDLLIRDRRKTWLRCKFPAGQAELKWSDIPDLPAELKTGLPPGLYQLRAGNSGSSVKFQVLDPATLSTEFQIVNELRELIASEHDPIVVQVTVEALLQHTSSERQPQPLLVDAVDLLESVPPAKLTKHLAALRDRCRKQLLGKRTDEPAAGILDSTGIAAIDEARSLILQGQWTAAAARLNAPEAGGTPRARALSQLYQAVILAESGQSTGAEARTRFATAIAQLQKFKPADSLVAHNNYANFLLGRAQDALYNHAFQAATAVRAPLMTSLTALVTAESQYQQALEIARKINDQQQQAAVRTNLARGQILLADLLRVLNSALPADEKFLSGKTAAIERAREELGKVFAKDSGADVLTTAAAREMQAHLAYRRNELFNCELAATWARNLYASAGSLAGAESVHRLLGLLHEQQGDKPESLRHLRISQKLAEILRARFPEDKVGLTRAGFFARRAYVNEHIVRQLIALGRTREALEVADAARARTLQDVLSARATTDDNNGNPQPRPARSVEKILQEWPVNVVALEYYLGSEHAWVFVITPDKNVKAIPLRNADGTLLQTRKLVADVQDFLVRMNSTASKLIQQAGRGGFDHGWQKELYEFRRQLLPREVLPELRDGRVLAIVPQHVLHYFPFAALVFEQDSQPRGRLEMPQPKFLIDQPISVCLTPSLAAWDLLRQSDRPPLTSVRAIGLSEFTSAPPLPGVTRDLAHVQEIFGDQLQGVWKGSAATEAAVMQQLQQPGMVFFATHGVNLADRPLASHLLLQATDVSDGLLTSWEVFNQRIEADLIVMSACFSGLADRSPLAGDDLFGLERAYLHAGCRNVVSSNWDVYDDTGVELIQSVLKNLRGGTPVPAAVAQAQRDFLRDRRAEGSYDPWIHPYFWAVFKSTGADNVQFEVQ